MNPGSSETSGLNLPPPVGEAPQLPVGNTQGQPAKPEQGPAASERNTQAGQSASGLPVMPLPLPASTPPAGTPLPGSDSAQSSTTTSASAADDGDLIEKEWVNKAKAIVERTRDNPHEQSQELTVVKADYMKQRYDKTIKVEP